MPIDIPTILKLRVPLIVHIGDCQKSLDEVMSLVPGSIIELDKNADEELTVHVNNKTIGRGSPVKVGENYGMRVNTIDPPRVRLQGLSLSQIL